MSFRTVVITNRSKLSYKNGFMVIRSEDIKMIYLQEIYALIIDSTAVSITSYLLNELCKHKIAIIVCDDEHNPSGQCLPINGHHHSSKKIRTQIAWDTEICKTVWTKIVSAKILAQASLLQKNNKQEAHLLLQYNEQLEFDDVTNREGHAAKVYFNALFGLDFSRREDNIINAALNYGYAILLSLFNKEIISCGLITQLGIKHNNEFNAFNLSCDLMEPFRVIIDEFVYNNREINEFNSAVKFDILNLFNTKYYYDDCEYYLTAIISMYVKTIINAIEMGLPESIIFPNYEL